MKDETLSDKEMASRIRKLVLDVIVLWSSKRDQLHYQKNVPIANVSVELFEQWDDVYHPENSLFKQAFSESELTLLEDFENVIIRETSRVSLYNLPEIEHFVHTLEWGEINKYAIELLQKLTK
jgi:hypothetical protein